MQHMRLISEAYAEIKERDPETAITKHAFRMLVNNGRIKSIQVGRKKLVAMEEVDRFFFQDNEMENDVSGVGKIRIVNE